MAYARLDIYWPDGRIESYLLEAPNITVGRAADNTIVLDTETVSRHHFSITHTNNSTYLNDLESENGVMIDGMPLKTYEAHMLEGVEELQVGFLRIIYHPMDESVTVPMKATTEETQRTKANTEFSVRLDVSNVDVWPASSASAEIAITNHMAQVRRFSIKISGMPSEWMRVNRPEIELSPNDTTYVLINIKPPRKTDVRPQDYTITIEVIPKDRTDNLLVSNLPVKLHAFGGFGMRLSADSLQQGDPLLVTMQNHGSEELTIALSGRAKDNAVQPRFSMPRVTLSAGARSQVKVEVVPNRQIWFGQPRTHHFYVIAQAQNASRFVAAQEAHITLKPRLSGFMVVSALAAMALLIGILVVAIGALRGTPAPTLDNLRVNRTDLIPGDDFILSWDASNAELYRISINQVLVTEVPGATRSVTLSTDGYIDDIMVAVVAVNGEQSAVRQLTVDLTVPLLIASFDVQPARLVRYVVSTLQLSWNTSGAQDVTLTGLDTFTNAPLPEVLPLQGQLEALTGFAQEALNITLTARDELGNTISQNVRVDVTDATCTSLRTVPLFDRPGTQHQQVSTVPENTPLVVVARDPSAAWLRIGLPGDLPVWGETSEFTCADTFSVNDLRVEISDPLTTPTSTATAEPVIVPTATPTPTVTPRPTQPTPPAATLIGG